MSEDAADPSSPDAVPVELVAQYREQLPITIRALEAALDRYRREPDHGAAELRRLAHQLAGSGGSYGFPEISARAREAEQAAEPGLVAAGERLVAVLRTVAAAPADANPGAVLIVNREPGMVRRLEQILSGPARMVRGAATTAEALALCARESFDLIVLDLHLPEEDKDRILAAAAAPSRSSDGPVPKRPRRILLAEDDQLMAAMVRHRLEKAGYEIRHATNGTAALAAAEQDPPDLFVLDIKMPGMDGLELLRRLRAAEWGKTIPAIMLTALGSDQDLERAFAEGAQDYVVKPFSPAELLARVERLIRGR
jgi:DNA-binding response OmpR family regulator